MTHYMTDAALVARWQFAFTIMFHYLFPVLTIGLGVNLPGRKLEARAFDD